MVFTVFLEAAVPPPRVNRRERMAPDFLLSPAGRDVDQRARGEAPPMVVRGGEHGAREHAQGVQRRRPAALREPPSVDVKAIIEQNNVDPI